MKTREQKYADKAYNHIKDDVKVKVNSFQGDYKTAAKNLAFLIRSAGLVQALYFTETRNDGSKKLIEHLKDTLDKPNLLDEAREKPINEYMYLTERCLLALKWYKRCVDIHIADDDKRPKNDGVENENDEA